MPENTWRINGAKETSPSSQNGTWTERPTCSEIDYFQLKHKSSVDVERQLVWSPELAFVVQMFFLWFPDPGMHQYAGNSLVPILIFDVHLELFWLVYRQALSWPWIHCLCLLQVLFLTEPIYLPSWPFSYPFLLTLLQLPPQVVSDRMWLANHWWLSPRQ